MYGMVNKGFEWMVRTVHGDAAWDQVSRRAGVADEPFLGMQNYSDQVTVDMVGALAEVTDSDGGSVLRDFGRHWVRYVSEQGYESLLKMSGRNLEEILSNLDDLHTRIAANFPEFTPPSFECEVKSPTRLDLHYRSERQGLATFVIGLVEGVAEFTGETIEIELVADHSTDTTHQVFAVRHEPRA